MMLGQMGCIPFNWFEMRTNKDFLLFGAIPSFVFGDEDNTRDEIYHIKFQEVTKENKYTGQKTT